MNPIKSLIFLGLFLLTLQNVCVIEDIASGECTGIGECNGLQVLDQCNEGYGCCISNFNLDLKDFGLRKKLKKLKKHITKPIQKVVKPIAKPIQKVVKPIVKPIAKPIQSVVKKAEDIGKAAKQIIKDPKGTVKAIVKDTIDKAKKKLTQ